MRPGVAGLAQRPDHAAARRALCNAADKMRKELLKRARKRLKVDAAKLQIRDGVISSTDDPKKKITFAELAKANKGSIKHGRPVPAPCGDRTGR